MRDCIEWKELMAFLVGIRAVVLATTEGKEDTGNVMWSLVSDFMLGFRSGKTTAACLVMLVEEEKVELVVELAPHVQVQEAEERFEDEEDRDKEEDPLLLVGEYDTMGGNRMAVKVFDDLGFALHGVKL